VATLQAQRPVHCRLCDPNLLLCTMPLPEDPAVVETSQGLVNVLKGIFGPHPGFRPAHAKGVLLEGTFQPSATASELSAAPHFTAPSTPVVVRFSSSTGLPEIPDTDPNTNPHGFALRFVLATSPRHVHTDIIAHSTPFFPVRTGEEFLAFLTHAKNGTVPEFLGSHPKALAFVQAPKPFPSSLAKEAFFGVNAFILESAEGKETYVRYRVVPEAGVEHLDEKDVQGKDSQYLFGEIPERLKKGPIVFHLKAQVAEEGDITDDATEHWPEDRKVVDLGTISLTKIEENNAEEQRKIIFDPIPRDVKGVKASADPLLDVRAGVYLISGRERRAAK